MEFETTVEIAAPPERVWALLADLERWPTWTESMQSVTPVGSAPFGVGTEATVRQPKLPSTRWTVTEVESGVSFTWVAKAPGLTTSATHRLEAAGDGTRLTLGVHQAGIGAGLTAALFGKRTRQYVQMEAEGLRRAAEEAAAAG